MSAKRVKSDMNDLSVSLNSIISNDALGKSVNIPFVDEDTTQIEIINGKSSADSISSNESYPEKAIYNMGRRAPAKQVSISNATGNDASGESDSDDDHLASEGHDRPGPLASEMRRVGEVSMLNVMRRNSISMPVLNEIDLDALRNLHMQAVESNETMNSKESLSKITVSNLCFD